MGGWVDAIVASPPYSSEVVGAGKVNIDFSKAKTGLRASTPARLAIGEAYGTHPA